MVSFIPQKLAEIVGFFSGVTGWDCFRRYQGCIFSRLPGERVSRLLVVVFFAVTGGPFF